MVFRFKSCQTVARAEGRAVACGQQKVVAHEEIDERPDAGGDDRPRIRGAEQSKRSTQRQAPTEKVLVAETAAERSAVDCRRSLLADSRKAHRELGKEPLLRPEGAYPEYGAVLGAARQRKAGVRDVIAPSSNSKIRGVQTQSRREVLLNPQGQSQN